MMRQGVLREVDVSRLGAFEWIDEQVPTADGG